jgi:hypothetical protein
MGRPESGRRPVDLREGEPVAVPLLGLEERPRRGGDLVVLQALPLAALHKAGAIPHLRLTVENARCKRAAHRTRVIVVGVRRRDTPEPTSLSHPSLAWPSAGIDSDAEPAVTIHSGTGRPIGVGKFLRPKRGLDGLVERLTVEVVEGKEVTAPRAYRDDDLSATWHLMLDIHGFEIIDDRDKLTPGEWTIQLLVAADDGDAQRYEVHVAWSGDAADAAAVLEETMERLHVEHVRRFH